MENAAATPSKNRPPALPARSFGSELSPNVDRRARDLGASAENSDADDDLRTNWKSDDDGVDDDGWRDWDADDDATSSQPPPLGAPLPQKKVLNFADCVREVERELAAGGSPELKVVEGAADILQPLDDLVNKVEASRGTRGRRGGTGTDGSGR